MVKKSFNIPKGSHRDLIGRGGAVVRKLEADFEVRVKIPRSSEPSSVVTVEGTEQACAECRAEIANILGFEVSEGALSVVALDLSESDHGSIIGRGGSTIRELEREYGVDVRVPRRGSGHSEVIIEGSDKGIERCIAHIADLVQYEPKVLRGDDAQAAAKKQEGASRSNSRNRGGRRRGGGGGGGGEERKLAEPNLNTSKPISEALFFPDKNRADGWAFDRFLDYLGNAKKTIDICVFTISDNRIVNVLLSEMAKGVRVRILTDNETSTNKGSDIARMAEKGIATKMDVSDYHMHHKFAVIDGHILINGSFNWTRSAAEKNSENITITNQASLVKAFQDYFNRSWADESVFKPFHEHDMSEKE